MLQRSVLYASEVEMFGWANWKAKGTSRLFVRFALSPRCSFMEAIRLRSVVVP